MIKKQVKYTNFDGEEVTETVRFNLSRAELIRMEAHTDEGLEEKLSRILKAKEKSEKEGYDDPTVKKEIFDFFEQLIDMSYGIVRDGVFVKDATATARFMASEAYSELLLSLLAGGESEAADFVKGVLPPVKQGVIASATT